MTVKRTLPQKTRQSSHEIKFHIEKLLTEDTFLIKFFQTYFSVTNNKDRTDIIFTVNLISVDQHLILFLTRLTYRKTKIKLIINESVFANLLLSKCNKTMK